MILVTSGTLSYPFKRLVDTCYDYFRNFSFSKQKIIIQTGSYNLKSDFKNIETVSQIPFDEMLDLYQKANLIISAAGEGSVSLILHYASSRPILFPRQRVFNEHVDDQQVMIAQAVAKKNLSISVYNQKRLQEAISNSFFGKKTKTNGRAIEKNNHRLIKYLDELMD